MLDACASLELKASSIQRSQRSILAYYGTPLITEGGNRTAQATPTRPATFHSEFVPRTPALYPTSIHSFARYITTKAQCFSCSSVVGDFTWICFLRRRVFCCDISSLRSFTQRSPQRRRLSTYGRDAIAKVSVAFLTSAVGDE